jgi:osmoprotectant transport system permease protein
VGAGAEGLIVSDLLNFFADNTQLLFDKTLEHLGIAAIGMVVALVLAMPLGVYLGHRHAGSFLAINISNVFRALPSLALIAISLAFFGLSRLNVEIALVALAVPPILTNAYTAVDGVDPDAVEAARGMGMTERQVLTQVELPLSWPLIFAGIRTAAVYVVATAPLAAIAGGGGLGDHPQPAHLRARRRDRRDDRRSRPRLRRRPAVRAGPARGDAARPAHARRAGDDRPGRHRHRRRREGRRDDGRARLSDPADQHTQEEGAHAAQKTTGARRGPARARGPGAVRGRVRR